jgi:stringent starvation protein B
VAGDDQNRAQRLREIFTALLERRLSESLGEVERALSAWKREEVGVFEAHAELLKHAARAERLIERLLQEGDSAAASLLRDAFDATLVDRDEFVHLIGCHPEEVEPPPPLPEASPVLPDKREVLEELLEAGPVLVQLDARREGVDVPERFLQDARLVLRLGRTLTPPIVDLELGESGLGATLTFSGVAHRCVLPWPSVYAMVSVSDQRRMVWPDDVPAEALAGASDVEPSEQEGETESGRASKRSAKKRGNHLKLVK